jgi:hypothetical protein
LGYAEFQDVASAENSINFYQGYQGLGGRGLQCEMTPYTLAQLTGTAAAGSVGPGQKRAREDGERTIVAA